MDMRRSLLPALVMAMTGGPSAAEEELRTIDLAKLRDPATSVGEANRILSEDNAEQYKYIIRHLALHKARQNDPESQLGLAVIGYGLDFSDAEWFDGYKIENPDELFAGTGRLAFAAEGFDAPALVRLDSAKIIPVNPAGKEVPMPDDCTYINDGYLFDFDRDGAPDAADTTNCSVTEARAVHVLRIRSIEPSPRTILRAIYNWELFPKDEWGFECFDDGDDGTIEIAFGPKNRRSGAIERTVICHRDQRTGTYEVRSEEPQSRVVVLPTEGELSTHLKRAVAAYKPGFLDEEEPEPEPAAASPDENPLAPFEYRSLRGASNSEILAFMNGRPAPDSWRESEQTANALPDGFWSIDPKEAALQLVEANRSEPHRDGYRLALDDRGGIAPPESGWVLHDYHGDNSYTNYAHVIAIRFGTENPYLLFASERGQGVVGANPLVDRPGFAMRLIALTAAEARFVADTVFWLDRIRTRAIRRMESQGASSSSADGWASLHLIPDGQSPRQIEAGTVPAFGSLTAQLTEDYEPNTCMNIVNYLLGAALPKQIAERWDEIPHLEHSYGMTGLKDPHPPVQADEMRASLDALSREIFRRHSADPVPATVLRRIVKCAGAEGLAALRGPLETLAASLPPENAEDREFERLRKRFGRDHFGNWLQDDGWDEKHKADFARYEKLVEERRLNPAAVLRGWVAFALKQLNAVERPEKLMAWARSRENGSGWALQQLARRHPEAHADVLAEQFDDAEGGHRETIFRTLAEANPEAALRMVGALSKKEQKALLLPLASVECEVAPERAKARVPDLLALAESKDGEESRDRGRAMELLGKIELTGEQFQHLEALALAALDTEKGNSFNSLFGIATDLLLARDDRGKYWDAFRRAGMDAMSFRDFESIIDALAQLAADSPPEFRAVLEEVVRRRLATSDGMMQDAFLAALALDLRGLRPEFSKLATSGPDVPDSPLARSAQGLPSNAGGQLYHAAREVLALWEENDPATRARLWIALVISHPTRFGARHQDEFLWRELRARAEENFRPLPPAERKRTVQEMLAAKADPQPDHEMISWLE